MRRSRPWAVTPALVSAAVLLTACSSGGSSHSHTRTASHVSTPAAYPPATGTRVSRALAGSISAALGPAGLPSWATPPLDATAARVAIDGTLGGAFVVPLRAGPGWCLGYLRDQHPSFGWCTTRAGSSRPVEGGVIFVSMSKVAILARASARTTRLVVTRADGRRIAVALRHGVALAPIGEVTMAGDRPVSVQAIDHAGNVLAQRSLGWTAERWRAARPHPFVPPTRAKLRALLDHPRPPCVGAQKQQGSLGVTSGEITFVAIGARQSAVSADILPTYFGQDGGKLYLQATSAAHVTLVDNDGTRRAIALGPGHCAYVTLSPRDRRAPFLLETRTASGRDHVVHPGDWSGFPTDGS